MDIEFLGPDDYSQTVFTSGDLCEQPDQRSGRRHGRADGRLAPADAGDAGAVPIGSGESSQHSALSSQLKKSHRKGRKERKGMKEFTAERAEERRAC